LDATKYTTVEFSNETVGTNIPSQFVPAVSKGFHQSLEKGLLSGNKVTGIHFRLKDGSYYYNTASIYLHKFYFIL
jgi:elongation factor G